MSTPTPPTPREAVAPPDIASLPLRIASLFGSVGFHVGLYAFMLYLAVNLRGCGDGMPAVSNDSFRQIGIYLKDLPADSETRTTPVDADTTNPNPSAADAAAQSAEPVHPEVEPQPPIPLTKPELNPGEKATIGSAPLVPGAPTAETPTDVSLPAGVYRPPVAGGSGVGSTKFFDIRDTGKRFVYVVDCSSSMTGYEAIRAAKAELIASLESLDARQQFQVIFYNEKRTAFQLQGKGPNELYPATDINRTLARQFIASIKTELGTDHFPALQQALALEPEIIFFLTDAGDPPLDRHAREQIRKLNNGQTHIHCIEFGEDARLSGASFLERLASENGGTYRYVDVKKLPR